MEKNITIALGSDHGGFELKSYLIKNLVNQGYKIIDCGTYDANSCNYPTFAFKTAEKVASNQANYGFVICTSGEGVCISANKVKGIRCGLCYNLEVARLTKEHNDCNMLAFGAKYISKEDALKACDIFLNTEFGQGRHTIRRDLITEYENSK